MISKEIANTLESNQKAIKDQGKLEQELLQKVNYKIRLDWNYYSNRMEGGTLTAAETRSVMIGNIDIKGKPMKDVIEMNGHDQVVLDILSMASGKMRLSEKRIKEIHKAIMHETDSEKQKQIGKWKTEANEIINYKNEKVRFTEPADVADEMHKLINWLNTQIDHYHHPKKTALHPVEIAAQFHLEYVSIHPFYDGNGRTARILTNLILISFGYPPIIIKDEHKKQYYNLLSDIQSYGGKPDLFFDFVAERVIETQDLYLAAIEGENLDDEEDYEKRLKLIEQKFEMLPEGEKIKNFNSDDFDILYEKWFTSLIVELNHELERFNKFFKQCNFYVAVKKQSVRIPIGSENAKELLKGLSEAYKKTETITPNVKPQLSFNVEMIDFKKKAKSKSVPQIGLNITYGISDYEIQFLGYNQDKPHLTDHTYYHRIENGTLPDLEETSSIKSMIKDSIVKSLEYNFSISETTNRKNTEE